MLLSFSFGGWKLLFDIKNKALQQIKESGFNDAKEENVLIYYVREL